MPLYNGTLSGAKLISAAGHPAYVLIGDNGEQIIDASSGLSWSELTAQDIKNVAERLYQGSGNYL